MSFTRGATEARLEDFIERNRCKLFIKCSAKSGFVPVCDSLQVVGCAMPAEEELEHAASGRHCSRYYVQLAVLRRTDYARCLSELFAMSLRKERRCWLLLWLLLPDLRFLARVDPDKAIMQGALMHRGFWVTARESERIRQKKGPYYAPPVDYLMPSVGTMLGQLPDRMVTVTLAWVPRNSPHCGDGGESEESAGASARATH